MGRKSWVVVGVLVALWAIGSMLPPRDVVLPGEIRVLGGSSAVWLATTSDDYDAMLDAQNAAARGGPGAGSLMLRLAESGRARAYPGGSEVQVIETAVGSALVEIASGEDKGRQGWVQKEMLAKPR